MELKIEATHQRISDRVRAAQKALVAFLTSQLLKF